MRSIFRRLGLRSLAASSGLPKRNPEGSLWAPVPLERFGLRVFTQPETYNEEYNKHKMVQPLKGKYPVYSQDRCFIAPDATLVGNVQLSDKSSVWYNAVLNATNLIRVGWMSNVQDETIITDVDHEVGPDHDGSTIIGTFVVIGHKCVLKACTVESQSMVGMGSILHEGSYVERESILAAGSVLPPGARVPSHQVWGGNPARYLRQINSDELHGFRRNTLLYWEVAQEHLEEFYLPNNFAYVDAERLGIEVGYRVKGMFGAVV